MQDRPGPIVLLVHVFWQAMGGFGWGDALVRSDNAWPSPTGKARS